MKRRKANDARTTTTSTASSSTPAGSDASNNSVIDATVAPAAVLVPLVGNEGREGQSLRDIIQSAHSRQRSSRGSHSNRQARSRSSNSGGSGSGSGNNSHSNAHNNNNNRNGGGSHDGGSSTSTGAAGTAGGGMAGGRRDAAEGPLVPGLILDNGKIMIDPNSLIVTAEQIQTDREREREVVHENATHVTYASYTKRTVPEKWTPDDTAKFYKALRQYGTDFALISQLFPSRTRKQVKSKFKKEEKLNAARVENALLPANRLAMDLKEIEDSQKEKAAAEARR